MSYSLKSLKAGSIGDYVGILKLFVLKASQEQSDGLGFGDSDFRADWDICLIRDHGAV